MNNEPDDLEDVKRQEIFDRKNRWKDDINYDPEIERPDEYEKPNRTRNMFFQQRAFRKGQMNLDFLKRKY